MSLFFGLNQPNGAGLLTGLVSYWKLGEASGSRVDSHNTNTLSSNNSVGQSAGRIGNAANFDATSSQYLSLASADLSAVSFVQNSYQFTIAAWIKLADESTTLLRAVMGNIRTVGEKGFYVIYDNRTGIATKAVRIAISNGSASAGNYLAMVSSDNAIPDTGWHHLVITGDGSNVRQYVDLAQVGTAAVPTNFGTGNSTRNLLVGAAAGAAPDWYWNGLLDELCIWNRALSTAERAALYNTGLGLQYPF